MGDAPGERIARARRRRGLSQAVLAGLVGRSESWLSQVERGKRGIDSYSVLVRWFCGHRRIMPITQCHCVACRGRLPSCCARTPRGHSWYRFWLGPACLPLRRGLVGRRRPDLHIHGTSQDRLHY